MGSAVATVNVPSLGVAIADLCREHKLTPVGILYLPAGDSPKGMEGIFVPGAWQLVANVQGLGLPRGRFIIALAENQIPEEVKTKAATLTTPTFFTAS